MKKVLFAFVIASCCGLASARAQTPTPAAPPARRAARQRQPPWRPIDDQLKALPARPPTTRPRAIRPASITGTVSDIPVGDAKKGLTIGDVVTLVGQHQIAINFVWTLVAGFLVMFMQAGFAIVETGLCRAKNANHTMMMNFMVYGVGMLAYWLIGFAIQEGRRRRGRQPRRHGAAQLRVRDPRCSARDWGLFGRTGSCWAAPPMTSASW